MPIREGGRLLGSMVLVTPVMSLPTDASQRRRAVNAKSPWTALYAVDDIVGDSPAMQYARQLALSAARVDSTVFAVGRKRHRQRTLRPRHPHGEPARARALCAGGLLGH